MTKFIKGILALVLILVVSRAKAQCLAPPAGDEDIMGPIPDKASYSVRERVTYSCTKPGYQIVGSTTGATSVTMRCRNNGNFSKPRPCCEEISCTSPPDGINTVKVLEATKVEVGTLYRYKCNCGFTTTDRKSTRCRADGTWSFPAPNCTDTITETPCEAPWIRSTLGICYKISVTFSTWLEANSSCNASGGVLAMPKTTALLQDLAAISSVSTNTLWIGGGQLDTGRDSVFRWLDGTSVAQPPINIVVQTTLGREMITFRFAPPSYSLFYNDESLRMGYICQKN